MKKLLALSLFLSNIAIADIYLVRHAEKQAGEDPALTACGEQRAEWLADFFAQFEVDRVFSSQYQRTQQTAAPIADRADRVVEAYNAADLEGFSQILKPLRGETVVVLGHSNTNPELAQLITGHSFPPIADDQYDLIFVIGESSVRYHVQSFSCSAT